MFANGGRRVKATLIDRIQDRYGHTIFQARRPRMPWLRCALGVEKPARAPACRSPRAGAGHDDGLSDHPR